MKQFCTKVFVLILILGTLVWGMGWCFRQTTTYQNMEINDETFKFQSLPEKIEIAVLGASHGRDALDFTLYTQETFNFALSSQTPRYDVRMLCEYGDRLGENAIVVSTVSPMFMYFTEPEDSFIQKQKRYYRVLSPQNIIDCDFERWCMGRFSTVLTENVNTVIGAFLKPPKLATPQDPLQNFCVEQSVIDEEIERIKRDHIAPTAATFPTPDPLMYCAYEEIAQLCKENGWRLVWVTPPYTQDYLDCFADDFFPEFYRRMSELSQKYDIPYLDFSHDPRFTTDYSLFRNIDHLNGKGQTLFTDIVMQDIEAIL